MLTCEPESPQSCGDKQHGADKPEAGKEERRAGQPRAGGNHTCQDASRRHRRPEDGSKPHQTPPARAGSVEQLLNGLTFARHVVKGGRPSTPAFHAVLAATTPSRIRAPSITART